MIIYLVNKSTNEGLSDSILRRIAAAISRQLCEDFCPAYNLESSGMEYVAEADAPSDRPRLELVDRASEPEALGFHTETEAGLPIGEISIDAILGSGGDLLSTSNSVSVTLSHEACEMVADLHVDAYAMASNGRFYAWEVCDAVEAQSYMIDGVAVSDFVLPSWFDTMGRAPFNHMAAVPGNDNSMGWVALNAPFKLAPGGYAQTIKSPGTTSTIYNRYPDDRKARKRKKHPSTRFARRIAKRAGAKRAA